MSLTPEQRERLGRAIAAAEPAMRRALEALHPEVAYALLRTRQAVQSGWRRRAEREGTTAEELARREAEALRRKRLEMERRMSEARRAAAEERIANATTKGGR